MPKIISHATSFVSVPNATAQNLSLSLEALGALTRLASYSDNFVFKVEWLHKSWGIGRDKLRSILRELREAGYLKFEAKQVNGQFDGQEWHISTEPIFTEDGFTVLRDFSSTVFQEDNKKEESPKKKEKEKKEETRAVKIVAQDEIEALSQQPAYKHIDVAHEAEKARIWAETNRRQFSKRFLVNWLNRAKPQEQPKPSNKWHHAF